MITKEENIERLYNILKLDRDWDGYGSEPIPLEVVSKVKSLVNEVIIQPLIYLTGCKSIQLEWENEKYYMEVDIYSNEKEPICFMLYDNNKRITLTEFDTIDANKINNYLKKYFEGKGDMVSYA